MKLAVYFDGQFWVGVVEEEIHQSLRVARHIFGAEPKDTEVLAFVNRHLPGLLDLSTEDLVQPSAGRIATSVVAKINPKRRARQAAAEVQAQASLPAHSRRSSVNTKPTSASVRSSPESNETPISNASGCSSVIKPKRAIVATN